MKMLLNRLTPLWQRQARDRELVREIEGHRTPAMVDRSIPRCMLACAVSRRRREIGPRDPLSLAAASITMLRVAGIAAFHPAWRASRFDRATTLRRE